MTVRNGISHSRHLELEKVTHAPTNSICAINAIFFKKRIPALLGPDNRTLKLSTAAPGGRNERSLKLHRNSDYEIRLRWLATLEGEDMDWYCWEAKVDSLPTQATYESYDGTRLPEVAEK